MEFRQKQLRVLCLPGWRTNKDILSFQLSMGLSRAIKSICSHDENIELVCINPTHEASGPPAEIVQQFFPPPKNKYYEWHEKREVVEGNNIKIVYEGIDPSEKQLLEMIERSGRFDVLLGFSQGAHMAAYLSKRIETHPELLPPHLRWKCVVILAGFVPQDTSIANRYYTEKPLLKMIPSIHVIGEADFLKERNEALLELCQGKNSAAVQVIRHKEEHKPPTWSQSQKQLCDIVRLIRNICWRESFWAFDFDGVLCDSARETGLSGFKTGLQLQQSRKVFEEFAISMDPQHELINMFVKVRPYLETGYEATILIYLLICQRKANPDASCDDIVFNVSRILQYENGMMTGLRELMGVGSQYDDEAAKDHLKKVFNDVRERWTHDDLEDWLQSNSFFGTAVNAVKLLIEKKNSVYVITTKSKEFALRLLNAAGLQIPEDKVYGLGSGPKYKLLNSLSRVEAGKQCFFLEDRLDTLEQCSDKGINCDCTLAFATWGYNTKQQKDAARKNQYLILDENELYQYVRART